ncbi:MAG: cytochrome P450 [Acidimicrobiaceae bacterium]|nr:cytochrome P450 [Acidimicrobiaceae bacterium]MYF42624.1 cytochrome P450 [Acidimicrobiaceae bacterium]
MTARLQIPDLSSYETFVNGFPHDAFMQLREHAPVWWHEPTDRTPDGEGFWCVSTHEPVVEVFRTPRIYSSHTGGDRPYGGTMINDMEMSGKLLNMMDDPRHQRIRQLVSKGFTPKRITRLRADLEAITGSTLDSVAPEPGRRGSCDLVTDVAAELPLQAICLLLGAPGEDRHALCEWVDVTSSDFSDEVPSSVRARASANLFQYGQRLIRDRTANPRDDLLSVVIHGELPDQDPPRLDETEVAMFWSLLFTAGAETTRKAIATGIWELSKSPKQLEVLRADRSLMPAAVEEIVRWTTPSVYKRRTATRDAVLGGQEIRAGDKVVVWEMSANRDEAIFDAPFEFRIDRAPNNHVGFGHGPHFCLGANLARLEVDVMLNAVLDRWHEIEATGEPTYTRTNRLSGLRTLPIAFDDIARTAD